MSAPDEQKTAPPPPPGDQSQAPQTSGAYPAPPPQGQAAPPPQGGWPQGYSQQPGQGPAPAPPVYYPNQAGPGGPPPPYGQPPQHGTVVVNQPMATTILTAGNPFGEAPINMKCSFCHQDIVTSTDYVVGNMALLACFVIAFLGFWLGCCFIPFCVPACKDVVHKCPSCQNVLGRYNRLS